MRKKLISSVLSTAALVAGSVGLSSFVVADGMPTNCDGIENCAVITNSEQLTEFFTDGEHGLTREGTSTMIIGGDFTLGLDYYIHDVDLSIYLGDHTITAADYSLLFYDSTVNIYGGEGGLDNSAAYYAPLYVRSGSDVTMHSGTIRGGTVDQGEAAVIVDEDGKFTLNGGDLYGETWVVTVWKDAEFVMNGGTVTTTGPDSIGVSGNGSAYGTGAKLTLNAGLIASNDLGVYAPQMEGETYLGDDLMINATNCGVEIRAGELTVEGAEINVDENSLYAFNPNGNGSTATGVGIAVAQHTTKQAINVTVTDGVFTAPVAFAEGNPQINPEEDIEKVAISIEGGEFIATNGDPIVASEDVEEFITGGIYSKVPNNGNYVKSGYDVYPSGTTFIVDASPEAYYSDGIFLMLGESEELDLGNIGNIYATLTLSGDEIASIENRRITGTAKGTSNVIINFNTQIHPMSTTVPLVVYTVGADEGDVIEGETRDEVADFTAAQIKDLIESGEEANNSLQLYPDFDLETGEPVGSGIDRLKDVLKGGAELFTSLDAMDLYEDYWPDAEGMDCVGEHLGQNEEIAMVYVVNLGLYADDYHGVLGEITDLDGLEIDFDLEIPGEYLEAPEGYTREFSVLRFHRGVWDRPEFEKDGDVLKTKSSIFSTYLVAYTDTTNSSSDDAPADGSEADSSDSASASTSDASTPDTGTVTMAGASASTAAIVTALVSGILTAAVSFSYFYKKLCLNKK